MSPDWNLIYEIYNTPDSTTKPTVWPYFVFENKYTKKYSFKGFKLKKILVRIRTLNLQIKRKALNPSTNISSDFTCTKFNLNIS